MSNQNYITNILNLKENNLIFKENFYKEEKINGIIHKIFEAYLSYKPSHCPKCGVAFDNSFEKHGFITSNIKILDVSGFKSILKLHKQRYLCKHCHKAFTLSTNIVNYGCFISNNTKYKIALDLTKKRSEKDIAFDNNVSPNTVERVMDSYYNSQKLYKFNLPEVLSFDEFKSVKSADGSMSFHMCDGITGQTIDIVEDRRLDNLIKYFFYYDFKARQKVKFIIIDMYSPYISLIKKMFPNANIIIDKFHLSNLISTSLNKTRIMIMNKNKKYQRKFKRYWRLILKDRNDLDISKWKKFPCFDQLMTEIDIVDFLINLDLELKNTYYAYQNILHAFKSKKFKLLISSLNCNYNNISSYMLTLLKLLKIFYLILKIFLNIIFIMALLKVIITLLKLSKELLLVLNLLKDLKLEFLFVKVF